MASSQHGNRPNADPFTGFYGPAPWMNHIPSAPPLNPYLNSVPVESMGGVNHFPAPQFPPGYQFPFDPQNSYNNWGHPQDYSTGHWPSNNDPWPPNNGPWPPNNGPAGLYFGHNSSPVFDPPHGDLGWQNFDPTYGGRWGRRRHSRGAPKRSKNNRSGAPSSTPIKCGAANRGSSYNSANLSSMSTTPINSRGDYDMGSGPGRLVTPGSTGPSVSGVSKNSIPSLNSIPVVLNHRYEVSPTKRIG